MVAKWLQQCLPSSADMTMLDEEGISSYACLKEENFFILLFFIFFYCSGFCHTLKGRKLLFEASHQNSPQFPLTMIKSCTFH